MQRKKLSVDGKCFHFCKFYTKQQLSKGIYSPETFPEGKSKSFQRKADGEPLWKILYSNSYGQVPVKRQEKSVLINWIYNKRRPSKKRQMNMGFQ